MGTLEIRCLVNNIQWNQIDKLDLIYDDDEVERERFRFQFNPVGASVVVADPQLYILQKQNTKTKNSRDTDRLRWSNVSITAWQPIP